jgi:glycyl-tRNA synthetase beta subunit
MVMDEDPALRRNRLALLREVRRAFSGVADLSRLPG